MLDVGRQVLARDGILGFWAGVKPNVVRTFLVQVCLLLIELQCYSTVSRVEI